jgi:hypothetical protein
MPLDDAERSVLAETERSLADDDPGLERRFRDGWSSRRSVVRIAIVTTALVLIVGLCWLDLAGQAFLILLLAVLALLATGWRPSDWTPAYLRDP